MRITESRLRRLVREAFVGDKERNAASAAYREMLQKDKAAARSVLIFMKKFSDSLTKLMSVFGDSPARDVVFHSMYCISVSESLCRALARVERVIDPVAFSNSLGDVITTNLQEPFCREFPEICKTQSFRSKTDFVNFAYRLASERDFGRDRTDHAYAFFIDALPRALSDIVILNGEEMELGSALEQISSLAAEFAAETASNAEGTVIGSLAGIGDPVEALLNVEDKIEAERNARFWREVDEQLSPLSETLDKYVSEGHPDPVDSLVSSLKRGYQIAKIAQRISGIWSLSNMSTDYQCSLWDAKHDPDTYKEVADFIRRYAEFLMTDPPDKTPSHNLVVKISGGKANLIIDPAQSAAVSKRISDEINQNQEVMRREKEAKERKARLGDRGLLLLFSDLIRLREQIGAGDLSINMTSFSRVLFYTEKVEEGVKHLERIGRRPEQDALRNAIEEEIVPIETLARLVRNFSRRMIDASMIYFDGPRDEDALFEALKGAYQEEIGGTNLLEVLDVIEHFMQVNGLG